MKCAVVQSVWKSFLYNLQIQRFPPSNDHDE